jgi:hypothetical protein
LSTARRQQVPGWELSPLSRSSSTPFKTREENSLISLFFFPAYSLSFSSIPRPHVATKSYVNHNLVTTQLPLPPQPQPSTVEIFESGAILLYLADAYGGAQSGNAATVINSLYSQAFSYNFTNAYAILLFTEGEVREMGGVE